MRELEKWVRGSWICNVTLHFQFHCCGQQGGPLLEQPDMYSVFCSIVCLQDLMNPSDPISHWLRAPPRTLFQSPQAKVHLGQGGSLALGKGQRQRDTVTQLWLCKLEISLTCTELSIAVTVKIRGQLRRAGSGKYRRLLPSISYTAQTHSQENTSYMFLR